MSREKQEQIVNRLAVLLNDQKPHWSVAGRLINKYGDELTLKVLTNIQPGFPLAYYIGAVRSEFQKSVIGADIKTLARLMNG
jgi:hypothetical protein